MLRHSKLTPIARFNNWITLEIYEQPLNNFFAPQNLTHFKLDVLFFSIRFPRLDEWKFSSKFIITGRKLEEKNHFTHEEKKKN